MPSARAAAEQIKQLYFTATKATIAADLERAIELLVSLDSDEARGRVAVYMDGLSQMRSEWSAAAKTTAPAKRTRGDTPTAAPVAKVRRR
jgi:hypothetical protein